MPAERSELLFKVHRGVWNFDRAICSAIGKTPLNHRGRCALDEFFGWAESVVDEEHPACRFQTVVHERPKICETIPRDVREPETEEDEIVAAVGSPRKKVRQH